jgi:ABC-type antimicrobial peptide transport system permease subunit
MMWIRLIFGGLGRRGLEAIAAALVLAAVSMTVGASLMVVEAARMALSRAEQTDRPDVIQVKSRFNRALFETPRSGNLPPLTLPVYEPLIDPERLAAAADNQTIVARQSFLRNVVSENGFKNIYIFGINPDVEQQVSQFRLARGRFIRNDDGAVVVLDHASADLLGIDIGGHFPVRKADGEDLQLTVVGILDGLVLRGAPPRTVEAPALATNSTSVSSGAFVSLRTSQEIFSRSTLTDSLVVARSAADVPKLVASIQEQFRLEPGVFVSERYSAFQRKVHDFVLTLALFTTISICTALLAGSFAANLLNDIYADRRRQYAVLNALGFSPALSMAPGFVLGMSIALAGAIAGGIGAIILVPRSFAMPSLMADLGTVEPTMDWVAGIIVIAIAVAAFALGISSTAWMLNRRPVVATLSEGAA